MTTQSNTKNSSPIQNTHPSALTKFQLSFEYDRTWNEAKQTMQLRTNSKK